MSVKCYLAAAFVASILAFGIGCSGSSNPITPVTPTLPACQTNNTAQVSLKNISPENLSFDVLIDNINMGSVAPQLTLGPLTVSAGATHTVVARVTNTAVIGCTASPSFAQCSTQTLTCGF